MKKSPEKRRGEGMLSKKNFKPPMLVTKVRRASILPFLTLLGKLAAETRSLNYSPTKVEAKQHRIKEEKDPPIGVNVRSLSHGLAKV